VTELRQSGVDGSTQRFRELVDELDAIVIESEPHAAAPSFVSRRAESVLGYPCWQWLDSWQFWIDHIHPRDREHVLSAQEQALAQGRGFELEYRMLAASGRVVWLRHTARLHADGATGTRFLSAMLTDVTERRHQQEKLERSLALLRATLDATTDGILVVDERGTIAGYNRKFVEMWNIPESVLAQASEAATLEYALDQLLDPEAFVNTVQALAEDTASESFDLLEFKDGRRFERYSRPQRIGRDSLARVWSFRDVTVRKRAEEALAEAERSFRETLENMRLLALALDAEGRVTFCNDHLLQVLGWAREELVGRSWFECAQPAWSAEDFPANVRDGSLPSHDQSSVRTRTGEERIISWNCTPLRDPAGSPIGVVAIGEDVTEALQAEEALRRNEEQLQRSQRMEAVGRLAGGVAHDFNNLLTAINGYSDFLVSQLDPESPLRRDAIEIQRAAQRAAALTHQLLAFSRRQVLLPRIVSLNGVVSDIDTLLRRLIGEDIRLETRVDPALGHVRADPGQLEQVIVNLAVNARDAMPDGGELAIETRAATLDRELAAESGRLAPGCYAVLTVSDTGVGIPTDARPHLFEPFFTTKEVGKGTGLGLATAFGIVKQSGGEILLESAPGRGTSFQIYLPVAEEPEQEPQPVQPRPNGECAATILLVEDEEVVRALVRQVLEREGYEVLEAADGPAALRLARSHEGQIDLLLTDVLMPQMGGHALAQAMSELRPGLRVLFTSGYTDEAIVASGVAGATGFIGKPFSPEDLVLKVRELLEQPAQAGLRQPAAAREAAAPADAPSPA
jgi:two-component system cell cycle sensor histidine kinase/response regulator CckA